MPYTKLGLRAALERVVRFWGNGESVEEHLAHLDKMDALELARTDEDRAADEAASERFRDWLEQRRRNKGPENAHSWQAKAEAAEAACVRLVKERNHWRAQYQDMQRQDRNGTEDAARSAPVEEPEAKHTGSISSHCLVTESVLREALDEQKALNAEIRARLTARDETLEFFRRYLRFDDDTIKLVNELVTAMQDPTLDDVTCLDWHSLTYCSSLSQN